MTHGVKLPLPLLFYRVAKGSRMKIYISKKNVYLSVFLFFAIFCPPLVKNVNLLFFMTAYSVVALLWRYQKETYAFLKQKTIRLFQLSFVTVALYMTARMVYDCFWGSRLNILVYLLYLYKVWGAFLFVQPIAVYVVLYCKRHRVDYQRLLKVIIMAGLIEACFTVMMLVFPTVRMYLLEIFFKNVYGSDMSYYANWFYNERFYGFANVLVDLFGFATGIICGLCWIYFGKHDKKYLVCFLVLLIVPLSNSITGVVMAAIGVFVPLFMDLKRGKKSTRVVGSTVFMIVAGSAGLLFLYRKAAGSLERLASNVLALFGNADNITSIEVLFSDDFWAVPSSVFGKLFGTGHSVYSTGVFAHSDVGYVNTVWLIGIVGCVFIKLFQGAYLKCDSEDKKVSIIFAGICFFVFEVKGIVVSINPGILIIFILMYACVMEVGKETGGGRLREKERYGQ